MKKIIVLVSLVFTIFISNAQCVTTLAGSGVAGYADGNRTTSKFNLPFGVALDASGNVYVADTNNNKIRVISSLGSVSTFLFNIYFPDFYSFNLPRGVVIDASGSVYISSSGDNSINIYSSARSRIGTGVAGYADGTRYTAQFNNPIGVCIDDLGNLYIADSNNNRIRKINPASDVTTFAGSSEGYADGAGTDARFSSPGGVAVDGSGNVYVADRQNHRIRKITPSGVVITLAGSGTAGYLDGIGTAAQFNNPSGVAIDALGNIYVADSDNNRIRKITSTGVVTTFAGSGVAGYTDGLATISKFNSPTGVVIDGSGNVYVADSKNNIIRKITPLTVTLNYSNVPLCKNLISAQPTLTGMGDFTGGTYSSTPPGLTIDSTTGVVTPNTSTLGTYTVTYTTPSNGGCQMTTTSQVVIIDLPTANISYLGSPFCKSLTTAQPVTLTGTGIYTGGTYSSTAGLTINTSTGAITPSTSTPGIYMVTYTTSTSSGCSSVSKTTQLTITALPTASISYSGSMFCKSLTNIQVVITSGTGAYTGGTYASTTGLTINSSNGDIDASTSSLGTYIITYTSPFNGGCQISATTQVTISALPTANISYLGNSFCITTVPKTVTLTGTGSYKGGTYSSNPSGLTINSTQGYITPSTSKPGTYTVTYTTPSNVDCQISTTTQITINTVPTVSINYSGSPFCISLTTAQPVTLSGTGIYTDGTYSSTAGLTIDTSTGAITPSTSNPGTYTVTYTTSTSSGCSSVAKTTQIKITAIPIIYYSESAFCKSLTTAQDVKLWGTGTYTGGTYSSTTGLSINSTTGAITPSISNPGTYNVTYTTPSNADCQISTTTQITINTVPTVSINYSGSPFCISLTTAQPVMLTGTGVYIGGTFSSTAGLTIDASTGAITPSTSTAGTYTITYATSTSSGCSSVSKTTQVTITAIPTASIIYSGTPFCNSLGYSQAVTLTGTGVYGGGTYSSTVGLSINSSSGAVTPSASTPGIYTVNYATQTLGGCLSFTVTTPVTITALPTVSINYSGSPFCNSLTSVQVIRTGTGAFTGGTYSSTTGLSINSQTGTINPSLSTAGTYFVTYTTPASGGCESVSTITSVVILPAPTASISADGVVTTSATITNGSAIPLQLNGTFNTVPNIQWTPALGISSTSVANPVVYPSTTTTYTASFVNTNGCTQTTSFTVNLTPQPNIGTLSLYSTNTTLGLFDTITVDIQLTSASDLYSLYMKLKGNAAVSQYLDYSGYTAGTVLGVSNVISTPPTVTNGIPDFGMTKVGAVPGYSGKYGLFYSFTFVPKNIPIPAGTTFCFYLDDVSAYNSTGIPCGLDNRGQYCYTFTNQVAVWPGDLNKSNTVTTADILPIGYFYNSTGPARSNANIQWTAQPATLWGYNHSATNGDAYKVFADSNGDGVINNADQAAIGFNMNKIHARLAAPITVKKNNTYRLAVSSGSLVVTPNTTIVNASLLPQTVTFTVNLNNSGGLSALYGISVNLVFDETIFDIATATVDYKSSIFGAAGTDCLVMNYASGKMVSVGLTRYANAAINGQGLLFKVTLQTKSTLTKSLTQTPVTAYVDAANNQTGDTLVVQEAPTTNFTIINNLGVDTIKQDEFVLYPNPVKVFLLIKGNSIVNKVTVFNSLGQFLFKKNQNNIEFSLDLSNLSTGNYFITVESDNNKQLYKIIKE